jgi:DNA-binding NarL/FixJ family response regulator
VRDVFWAIALRGTVVGSGGACATHEQGGGWLVTDRPDRRRIADVLVCGSTAVDAHSALAAFSSGLARSVVAAADPQHVVAALDGLDAGLSLVPAGLLDRARLVPDLTERQRAVLCGVLAGQTNAQMAAALQVRPVTIKREVASLFAVLGASGRFELMSVALDLGFRRRPVRP